MSKKNPAGKNETVVVTANPVTSKPEEGTSPLVPSYPLPPRGDFYLFTLKYCSSLKDPTEPVLFFFHLDCWAPLGVQFLPESSFSASSQQTGHPPEAGRLHGWNPHKDLQVVS